MLSARREMSVLPALEELKATKALLETLAVEALLVLREQKVQRVSEVMLELKAAAEQQAHREPREPQVLSDQMATWAISALLVLLEVPATRASTVSRACRVCRAMQAIRPPPALVKSKSSSMAATVAGRCLSRRGIITMVHLRLRVVSTMTHLL